MTRGRPTREPKERLLAVRLGTRHMVALQARAERQKVSLSEALRLYLDEAIARTQVETTEPQLKGNRIEPRRRRPNAEERKVFDQVFAVFGITPRARRKPTRRTRS